MNDAHPGLRTPPFTYTLRQMVSREEIVFKSVVRVLQGKTRHVWQHTEGAEADLLVLGAGADAQTQPADSAVHAVIHVAAAAGPDFHGLSLPLRVADVIRHLDQAGDEVAHRRLAPATTGAAAPPRIHLPVCLTRWPDPALLLPDVRYVKLAAALTGQPVTVEELAARTQFPLLLCHTFVQGMKAAGLIHVREQLPEAPASLAPTAHAAHAHSPPLANHLSLIDRIRSRLEMFVRVPAAK